MTPTHLSFTEPTYVVIRDGEGNLEYYECEPGTELGTGQPHVEPFTDEALAKGRVKELGYVFPEDLVRAPVEERLPELSPVVEENLHELPSVAEERLLEIPSRPIPREKAKELGFIVPAPPEIE